MQAQKGVTVSTVHLPTLEAVVALAFDGEKLWITTASNTSNGVLTLRVSDLSIHSLFSFRNGPMAFDGENMWITSAVCSTPPGSWSGTNCDPAKILKTRASDGQLLGTFSIVGTNPQAVAFDGANIWVADGGGGTNLTTGGVLKVRAGDGALLGTFTQGFFPTSLAFDGANVWVLTATGLSKM